MFEEYENTPNETAAESGMNGTTSPGETVRTEASPEETVRVQTTSGETVNAQMASGETVRVQTTSGETMNTQTAPGETVRGQASSGESLEKFWGTTPQNSQPNWRSPMQDRRAEMDPTYGRSGQASWESTKTANTSQAYNTTQTSNASQAYNTTQTSNASQTYRPAQPSNTSQTYNTTQSPNTPHYNYYQRQQQAERERQMAERERQLAARRRAQSAQPATKKKGRWPALIASALVFGLIAGSVTYGVNLLGNRIHPVATQSEGSAVTPQPTTLSLTTTGSEKEDTQSAVNTATTASGNKTVAQVAEETMPSLVTIATVSVQEMQSFFGIQEYEAEGAGTGVIVGENDTELLIATNEHVISGANQVSIGFIDEEVVSAQIKGEDASTDLAIVAVKKEDVPAETLSKIKVAVIGDSDALVLGEQVVAIGNALGVGQSVTSGYVSALGRELDLSDGYTNFTSTDLIQTDAAINSGNSGGALLNMRGELIGINEAKSAYTSAGVTVDNVGYAIPMSKAQPILEDMMNQVTRETYSEEEQGYLGVSLANVSGDMSQMYNMPEGVCFTEVAEGGPAAEAGAQRGDVLVEMDGRSILSADALIKELQYHRSGDTIEMVVLRADNGEYREQTLQVTLGTKDVLDALQQPQN